MRVQIITNLDNGAGLERDYQLLAGICREMGHEVNPVHIHRPQETSGRADLNIFLEVLRPEIIPLAPRNWMVPNSEWWGPRWDPYILHLDRILCKTADCFRIWKTKAAHASRCLYIGWQAADLWDPSVSKELRCLHIAGKSQTKNTAAVMEAWKRYQLPYHLTVSAFKPEIARLCRDIPNVRLVERFSAEELRHEMNACRFFVMPSKYEGYGHAIHEALGCRAVVITTDAEPMRAFSGIFPGCLVSVGSTEPMGSATAHIVSVKALAEKVRSGMESPAEQLELIGDVARLGFSKDNAYFHTAIREALNGI